MAPAPTLGLAERFLDELPPERRAAAAPSAPELGELLADAIAAGRVTWPDVPLPDADFIRHIAACLPPDADPVAALAELHAADLYLACACAQGEPRALAHFDEHFLAGIGRAWSGTHRFADFVDEVRQVLRVRLLVREGGAPPRIAGYAGRGPLGAWVRMAATRLAINLRQGIEAIARSDEDDDDGAASLRAPGHDPELEYLKTRYAAELGEALRTTLAALSARTASVLRLHYQEGVTVDAIGTMYRVSGRTVQRWLAEARATILAETGRLLKERLGVSQSQLDSLIGLVQSRLDISIYRHLPARRDDN
ncbi:MAG TPA: sigma factor-like helix-turn-helix DNA-binding protein [Kofleriaceae bacterium]|nr:sigma factor-like helix-turn-helix DNA-binding protein [Kofleriaceae bacterium]